MDDAETPWLTRVEAAAYLRVSTVKIDRLARRGSLTRYRLKDTPAGSPGSVRFRREELDSLLIPSA